jgi:hypothetical protein
MESAFNPPLLLDTCERYTATALSRIEAGFRGKLIVRMDDTDFSLWLLLAVPQL